MSRGQERRKLCLLAFESSVRWNSWASESSPPARYRIDEQGILLAQITFQKLIQYDWGG
jgi:hypothetical protein